MADNAIAAGIQPMNLQQGLNNYSSILGLQKQRQDLETGLYQQQQAQAQAAVQQQSAAENRNLAVLLADPIGHKLVDPKTLRPTENALDIILQVAPTTGQTQYKSLMEAAASKVSYQDSALKLTQGARAYHNARIMGAISDPDSTNNDLLNAIDESESDFKGTPNEGSMTNIAKITRDHVKTIRQGVKDENGNIIHPGVNDQDGGRISPEVRKYIAGLARMDLGASGTVGAGGVATPELGTVNVGAAGIQPIARNRISGETTAVGTPVAISGVNPQVFVGSDQQPHIIGGNQSFAPSTGVAPNAPNAPQANPRTSSGNPQIPAGYRPLPQRLPPQWNEPGSQAKQDAYNKDIAAARDHSETARIGAVGANSYDVQLYKLGEAIRLLNHEDPTTGVGTETLGQIAGFFGTKGGDARTLIQNYIGSVNAAMGDSLGLPHTNMGAEQGEIIGGNVNMPNGALLKILETTAAKVRAAKLFNEGLEKVTNHYNDFSRVPAFEAEFGKAYDIPTFRAENAQEWGDAEGINRAFEGLGPNGMKMSAKKRKYLRALHERGMLPMDAQ
jgi:hypothetical protein